MARTKTEASEQTRQAFERDVDAFLRAEDKDKIPRRLRERDEVPVYLLTLEDILAGGDLKRARAAGWQFLQPGGSGDVFAGHVTPSLTTKQERIASVSFGPWVAGAISALHEVEAYPEVQQNDYEARLLSIPGALVEALWLKPAGSDVPDLVVPYACGKELQRMRAYPVDRFFDVMRPLAKEFMKTDQG